MTQEHQRYTSGMKHGAFFCALALPALLFGQTDSNSITVTASKSSNLQPDQVVFSVDITSGLNTSLDDVLAALAGTGITQANLQGVSTASQWFQLGTAQLTPTVDWSFIFPVAWSKMKDTITALNNLQKSIGKNDSGLTMSFGVQGPQISSHLRLMQTCSAADLLADARAQAQKLADAAALMLGGVLGMSTSISSDPGIPLLYAYYGYVPACSLTVRFAATR